MFLDVLPYNNKLSPESYHVTVCSVCHCSIYNICIKHKLHNDYLLTSRTKTNGKTDRKQYTRSNASATARPLTLVKLAETLVCDWLNANERQKNGDINNHIAEDHFFYRRHIKSTVKCITVFYRLRSMTHCRKLVY